MAHPVVVIRQPGRVALYLQLRGPVELGRECDGLLLTDPRMSRRHCELRPEGDDVSIVDLGSSNGVLVDGRRITTAVRLGHGVEARVGDTVVSLVTTDDALAGHVSGAHLRRTTIDLLADDVAIEAFQPSEAERDSPTVTICFSDIESSTELQERVGDTAWYEVLSHHNGEIRRALAAHGGREVKNQGDGFFLSFPSARAAVHCAVAIQRSLADWRPPVIGDLVRVRVGLHTGEAIVDETGDMFGHHVNMAARIADRASGGQILVSSLVRELAASRGDIEFGEPIELDLKGMGEPVTAFPVELRSVDGAASA